MNPKDKNKIHKPKELNRQTLYERFETGMRPSGNNFKDLIFSAINKRDDGISKSFEHGLKLSPQEKDGNKGENVISFYEQIDGRDPLWTFSLTQEGQLCISSHIDGEAKALLTLTPDGKVGILNKDPQTTLDVGGSIGMATRIGTYKQGDIKADGTWQTILSGLKGCTMFEVIALAKGNVGMGNYAFLHAVASNAFSGRRGRVSFTRNHYAWWKWWKRLGLRWTGTSGNYNLEMKTFSNYGSNAKIEYHITRLWE